MNRFALLALYRSLTRHKLYAALNIGGLAIGIAVFLVLLLYVRFEAGFERWLPEHEKIYLVESEWNLPESPSSGTYQHTMGGMLEQLQGDFPNLVGTRVDETDVFVVRANDATTEPGARVDPDFFRLFALEMVRGDGPAALAGPANVLLSETIARKYFGELDPMGQAMTLTLGGETGSYRVAGVFRDLPDATDFEFQMLVRLRPQPDAPFWYNWGSSSVFTFLRFETPAEARAFEGLLPAFVTRHGTRDLGPQAAEERLLSLLPIAERHFKPQGHESASLLLTVTTLGIVGVLTLLIAIVNYVNLATARAALRAREVAMRKVLGASRGALVRQFLGEAVATVALAALIGLILAELSLPLVNAAGGLELSIAYLGSGGVLWPLVALVLLVGLGAGAYPAFLLARFPAASVLASARAPGGGRAGMRVREALVIFQFVLAIAFMIGTVVLAAQTRHVRQADLGFERESLVVVRSFQSSALDPGQRGALLAAFTEIPEVRSVAVADSAAGRPELTNFYSIALPGQPGAGPSLQQISTGPGFFESYGTRLLAGRLLEDAHGLDDATGRERQDHRNIVINRSAVSVLGFASPDDAVGQTVGGDAPRTIVGVVEDMRFFSPRLSVSPTYYTFHSGAFLQPMATLRVAGDPRDVMEAVRSAWQRTVPQVPFEGATADERLTEFYEADDRATRLFAIGAGLAVLIGCVGLWGLASFNTARRVKEMGIRKTLGASAADIVKLLVGQFLRPVLIANLIAWPLAYFAMRTWLAGFDDRVALSPLYFLGASLLAIAIAVLTVLGQSLRASRAAPAWALRHD